MMVESNKDYENFLEEVYTKDQLAGLIGEIELAKSYVYKKEQSIILSKKIENKVEMIDAAGKSIGTLFDTTPAYLTPKEMLDYVETHLKEARAHVS